MKKLFILLPLLLIVFSGAPLLAEGVLININTADTVELDKIPEVGPVIAERIIEYRNTNGPFKAIEEIKNVKGIGDATFLKMKDYITVGAGADPGDGGDDGNDQGDDDTSAHIGETDLSEYQETEPFKISAGRERLATVRTPIIFLATSNKNKSNREAKFIWSFGDGTKAIGTEVNHAYFFPGRYQVVLNGSQGEEKASARTEVLVTEAGVKITAVDLTAGYIEINNSSDKEQNLSGWCLLAGDKKHILPLDTIIGARLAIKIPLKAVGLDGTKIEKIVLTYPDGIMASGANLSSAGEAEQLAVLQNRLTSLRRQLAAAKIYPADNFVQKVPAGYEVDNQVESKNIITLQKEPSLIEKIKNVLFQ